MKKYGQITLVLGGFFLLVFLKQLKGNDEPAVVQKQPVSSVSTPQPTANQSVQSSIPPTTQPTTGKYKDGSYTGNAIDYLYGTMQVKVTISRGKITDVNFLQFPNDNPTSQSINSQSNVILRSEAIQAQNAQVDIVSGASDSSGAFRESLQSALQQAS